MPFLWDALLASQDWLTLGLALLRPQLLLWQLWQPRTEVEEEHDQVKGCVCTRQNRPAASRPALLPGRCASGLLLHAPRLAVWHLGPLTEGASLSPSLF